MKKLVLILAAVLMTAVTSNVFGQSTGINPHIDSAHTYTVAPDVADTYTWTLTTSVDGSGDNLIGTDPGDIATATGDNSNSISVTWKNPTFPTIYYLHLLATDSEGCTNHKALAVQPVNAFELFIENYDIVLGKDTINDSYAICASDVEVVSFNTTIPTPPATIADSASASDFTYNYQKDSLYYRIYPEGINTTSTTWSPVLDTTTTSDAVSVEHFFSTTPDGTYTAISGNTFTVPVENSEVWVLIVFDNGTTNEGLTEGSQTMALDPTSADGNLNPITNTPPAKTQLIKARPDTGGISTDFTID